MIRTLSLRSWIRNRLIGKATLAFLGVLAAGCSDEPTSPPAARSSPELSKAQTAAKSHLVVLRPGASMDLQRTIRQLGGTVERVTSEIGVLSVRGLTDRAAAQLAALPEVEGVAPDRQVQWLGPDQKLIRSKREAARVETDQSGAAFFADQWNLRVIQADDAWLTTPQGEGALVCVLDTGVDPTHVDLAGKVDLATSVSFVPSEPTILDFNLHGTAMASVITSNGLGMASVAPDARICAVKVWIKTATLKSDGFSPASCTQPT